MSWIVSYWMDLLELWKQVSAIASLLQVPPVIEIKKRIKVFIYYICVLMLNISSNVPHVQNYYSMRRSSKKIETDEEMHRKRRLSLKKSRLTYVCIIHAVK